jgi:galactose mutarotase-like enzyme
VFAIALKADHPSTYVLSDTEANSQLELVPERGGLVTHWRIGEQEMFYFDRDRFANPELSVRGGIPILFPICGNLPDDQYQLQGHTYTLKQHGVARNLPWQALGQDVSGAASLTLGLDSNAETKAVYPFDFHLAFTFRLRGHTLEVHQQFTNRSDQAMPFSTGLHPYFLVHDKSQLQFDIPSTEYRDQLAGDIKSFGGDFDFNQDEIDIAFQKLTASTATVTDPQLGRRLTLSWDDPYHFLVFWTVKGKDYYCLEPWTAPRNALNTGEHLLMVEPQQTLEMTVRLGIELL